MKTAIEYLIEEINKLVGIRIIMDDPIIKNALQMEKQQIMDAYKFGLQDEYVIGSEQYYNNYIGTDCP